MKVLLTHYYKENRVIQKQEDWFKDVAIFQLVNADFYDNGIWLKLTHYNLTTEMVQFNQNDDEFVVINDEMEW